MFRALTVAATLAAAALITGCAPDPAPPVTTIDPQTCWTERQVIDTAAQAYYFDHDRHPASVTELIASGMLKDRGTISQWTLTLDADGALVLTAPAGCVSEEPPAEADPCYHPQVIEAARETIETAAEAFNAEAGRYPSSVDELVEARYLKSHPKPGGWRIELTGDGGFVVIDPC